jgi:hypothetical protein
MGEGELLKGYIVTTEERTVPKCNPPRRAGFGNEDAESWKRIRS